MIKFLKENIIFVVSSIILLGLFLGLSELKKIYNTDQTNTVEIPTSVTTTVTEPQPTPDIIPSPNPNIDIKTTPEKIPSPVPALPPPTNTQTPQRFYNDERDD